MHKDLKSHQAKILKKVKGVFGTKKIYYKPILPRACLGAQARHMASAVDKCMVNEHNTEVDKLDLVGHPLLPQMSWIS